MDVVFDGVLSLPFTSKDAITLGEIAARPHPSRLDPPVPPRADHSGMDTRESKFANQVADLNNASRISLCSTTVPYFEKGAGSVLW
ncbi:MAG: hypothetical protein ACKPKO_17145, partial [Candidatus Fonsibacter sp.]